jgi:hypothetical protein
VIKASEHFCTLFDWTFVLQGMALSRSLRRHSPGSTLWVVCVDDKTFEVLTQMALPGMVPIRLEDVECERLLSVKPFRTRREYCWTLTPFVFNAVLDRAPDAERVTYVDADLYFFDDPSCLIGELEHSGKDILVTEHSYDPQYDQTELSGRFCVQFLCVYDRPEARHVLHWWQERCLEWCFARFEPDRFGDQKYLDVWPEMFGDSVHILERVHLALAPWNVRYLTNGRPMRPVFYHFHAFDRVTSRVARAVSRYDVGAAAAAYYEAYVVELRRARRDLLTAGQPVPTVNRSILKQAIAAILPWVSSSYVRI